MNYLIRFHKLPVFLGLIFMFPAFLKAQNTEAPLDTTAILKALKQMREDQGAAMKQRRMSAYNQIVAASASGERAVALWKEAAKTVMFEGAENEAEKVRGWRDSEGDALNSKECQNAARLHLQWLALSLQHAHGTETKKLLQTVIDFTKQVTVANEDMERFSEQIEKAKGRDIPAVKKKAEEDEVVKKVSEQIMRTSVAGTAITRWLQLGELLNDNEIKKLKPISGGWELVPANVDGMFNSIILPEFRLSKDPRLLEYWDVVIKRETDRASKRKLDVDQRDWANIKRPSLLWSRAQDVMVLGRRNTALNEMFTILKTYPTHPNAGEWVETIERLLTEPVKPATTTVTEATTFPVETEKPIVVAPKPKPVTPKPVTPAANPPIAVAVEVDDTVPAGTIPASVLGGSTPPAKTPAPK